MKLSDERLKAILNEHLSPVGMGICAADLNAARAIAAEARADAIYQCASMAKHIGGEFCRDGGRYAVVGPFGISSAIFDAIRTLDHQKPMVDDMITRVAKAMWEANRYRHKNIAPDLGSWESEPGVHEDWLTFAKAGIAAMQEPS